MKKWLKRIGYFFLGLIALVIVFLVASYHADIPLAKLEPKYLTPESSYLNLADAKVHIRQRGAGPAIVLIHGSFSSLHAWADWEAELSKSYHTISLDLPGHGLTGPNLSGNYSSTYYADLVIQLLDQLSIDSTYLIGNSMGGGVALTVTARHPDRVSGLVLVDSSGPRKPIADSNSTARRNNNPPLIFRMLRVKWLGNALQTITPKFLFTWNMKQVYADPEKIKSENLDRYYDLMLREGNRKATFERLQNSSTANLPYDSISTVKAPTQVLWGAEDRWIPASYGEELALQIPGAEFITLPDIGHVPMEESPEISIKPVMNFLQRQKPETRHSKSNP